MKKNEIIKSIFLCWDIYVALTVTIMLGFAIPSSVPFLAAKEVFSVSVTVIALIFSVFFAALAVLITAGDNEFVRFLEEDGSYQKIIFSFRLNLLLLFVALLVSIMFFISALEYSGELANTAYYPKLIILIFAFVNIYALFSSVNSILDAIKYAEYRARFLKLVGEDKDSD